ncbi:hypothetical protein Adt_11382 [Abeliophyllum distichum]|uniref:Uncharacterized protein n=1 Tax=Abeliophyllum distichum TaxID=126358 RepID=A0ABD1UNM8_9LAMI
MISDHPRSEIPKENPEGGEKAQDLEKKENDQSRVVQYWCMGLMLPFYQIVIQPISKENPEGGERAEDSEKRDNDQSRVVQYRCMGLMLPFIKLLSNRLTECTMDDGDQATCHHLVKVAFHYSNSCLL